MPNDCRAGGSASHEPTGELAFKKANDMFWLAVGHGTARYCTGQLPQSSVFRPFTG